MVSVSKRYFKHAVQRNRVKRQLREAYRKNKWILLSELSTLPTKGVSMAFLWMDGHLRDSICVEKQMCDLLNRIKGKIWIYSIRHYTAFLALLVGCWFCPFAFIKCAFLLSLLHRADLRQLVRNMPDKPSPSMDLLRDWDWLFGDCWDVIHQHEW